MFLVRQEVRVHHENEELNQGLFEDLCEFVLYLLPQQLFAFQLFF